MVRDGDFISRPAILASAAMASARGGALGLAGGLIASKKKREHLSGGQREGEGGVNDQ